MPHSPLGVLNISLVTGDDVNMDMQDTLASCRSYINPDIITIRIKLLINKVHTGCDFILRQVKNLSNMAFRNYHSMPRAHRVAITSTVRKLIIERHPFSIFAKQARVIRVAFFLSSSDDKLNVLSSDTPFASLQNRHGLFGSRFFLSSSDDKLIIPTILFYPDILTSD
jgi:hypothetical protein